MLPPSRSAHAVIDKCERIDYRGGFTHWCALAVGHVGWCRCRCGDLVNPFGQGWVRGEDLEEPPAAWMVGLP